MLAALLLLVGLLRAKVKLGRAMMIAWLALAVLLRITPGQFVDAVVHEWRAQPLSQTTGYLFVTLTALVMLVNVLAAAMQQTGVSQRLVPAMQGLFRSRRVALASIPLLMGMLPTPGGIMLSAPMVRDLGDALGVGRARQAAINFFFRHQWEPIWPLFPAVLLIAGLVGVPGRTVVAHNLPLWAAGITGGVVGLLVGGLPPRGPRGSTGDRHLGHHLLDFGHAFWPIVLTAAIYLVFRLPPAVGILAAVVVFLGLHRVSRGGWARAFRAGWEPDFALLILGALLFKLSLESAGAIAEVAAFMEKVGLRPAVFIFLLPMFVAALTGVTTATVAVTFPFLLPYIGTGDAATMGLETLAFSGLLCGLYITPVHLCLALSASYFDAPLGRIVLKILPSVCFIAAAGVAMALLFG